MLQIIVTAIAASILILGTVFGFIPPLQKMVTNKLPNLKPGLLPWIGLTCATVWTHIVIPPPIRGYFFGVVLLGVGALFAVGADPRAQKVQKMISNALFNGKNVFKKSTFRSYGWALLGAGVVIVFPFTQKFVDSIALFALIGALAYIGVRSHDGDGEKGKELVKEEVDDVTNMAAETGQ